MQLGPPRGLAHPLSVVNVRGGTNFSMQGLDMDLSSHSSAQPREKFTLMGFQAGNEMK